MSRDTFFTFTMRAAACFLLAGVLVMLPISVKADAAPAPAAISGQDVNGREV